MDGGSSTILVLLDVSAIFDTYFYLGQLKMFGGGLYLTVFCGGGGSGGFGGR